MQVTKNSFKKLFYLLIIIKRDLKKTNTCTSMSET